MAEPNGGGGLDGRVRASIQLLAAATGSFILVHEALVRGATERPILTGIAGGLLTSSYVDWMLQRRNGRG